MVVCIDISVRIALGILVMWAMRRYKSAVRSVFGPATAQLLFIVTISQFHFVFYMSRSLPNTFALIIGNTAAFFLHV